MIHRTYAAAGLALAVLMICFAGHGANSTALDGLPILVRVSIDSSFKNDTEKKYTSYTRSGSEIRESDTISGALEIEEIEKAFTAQLRTKLASWDTSDTLSPVFCETDKELSEKVSSKQGYMALIVVLRERRVSNDDFSLAASVQLYRLTGVKWEKLIDGRYKAEETGYKAGVPHKSDITAMVDLLDEMVMKNAILYEPIASTSRDSRTKVIQLRVGNPTSYDVTMIKWLIPASMDVLESKTEGRLKPGAIANLNIAVTSEGSHSAIQWRDIKIGEIKFAKPGE